MTTAAAAAARRAEIERKLALIQMEREREANLLSQYNKTEVVDAESTLKKLSNSPQTESLTVFGAVVKLGSRVKVQEDLSVLRSAEACLKRKDPMTHVYLGEPGEVITLTDSYFGKPAVEIRFCDGSTHWYFAECLAVGDRQPKAKASTNVAIAAPTQPRRDGDTDIKSPHKAPSRTVNVVDPNAPVALPLALPKRHTVKPIPVRFDKPSAFDEELQLLMEMSSNDSMGGPLTPGPARDSPTAVHVDPNATVAVPPNRGVPAKAAPRAAATKTAPRVAAAPPAPTPAKAKSAAALTSRTAAAKPVSAALDHTAFVRTDQAPAVATAYVDVSPTAAETSPQKKTSVAPTTTPQRHVASSAKPMLLKVYENGSYGDFINDRVPFKTVTVRPVHKSLASVLTLTAQQLQWNADGRNVEVLYDAATGKAIPSLAALKDGMVVVASTGDAFQPPRPNSVLFADLLPAAQELHRTSLAAKSARPATARAAATASSTSKGPTAAPTSAVAKHTAPAAKPAVKKIAATNINLVLDEIKALESRLELV